MFVGTLQNQRIQGLALAPHVVAGGAGGGPGRGAALDDVARQTPGGDGLEQRGSRGGFFRRGNNSRGRSG